MAEPGRSGDVKAEGWLYFSGKFIDPEVSHLHSLSSLTIVLASAIVPDHCNPDAFFENPKQEVIWKLAKISSSSPAGIKMVSFRVFASVIQGLFEFGSELIAKPRRNIFVISNDFQDLRRHRRVELNDSHRLSRAERNSS
jgi:hypothetical protein